MIQNPSTPSSPKRERPASANLTPADLAQMAHLLKLAEDAGYLPPKPPQPDSPRRKPMSDADRQELKTIRRLMEESGQVPPK